MKKILALAVVALGPVAGAFGQNEGDWGIDGFETKPLPLGPSRILAAPLFASSRVTILHHRSICELPREVLGPNFTWGQLEHKLRGVAARGPAIHHFQLSENRWLIGPLVHRDFSNYWLFDSLLPLSQAKCPAHAVIHCVPIETQDPSVNPKHWAILDMDKNNWRSESNETFCRYPKAREVSVPETIYKGHRLWVGMPNEDFNRFMKDDRIHWSFFASAHSWFYRGQGIELICGDGGLKEIRLTSR